MCIETLENLCWYMCPSLQVRHRGGFLSAAHCGQDENNPDTWSHPRKSDFVGVRCRLDMGAPKDPQEWIFRPVKYTIQTFSQQLYTDHLLYAGLQIQREVTDTTPRLLALTTSWRRQTLCE